MPRTIDIRITTTADLKGIQAVKKALEGLGGVGGKGGGGNPAAPLTDAGAAAAKTERQILALASAQARLQSTQGNSAGAALTLSNAIGKVDQSSISAIRAQTQLQQVQNKLSGQTQSLSSLFGNLGSQLGGLGGSVGGAASALGSLATSMGTIGTIGAALGLVKVGADLAQIGGQSEQTRIRFNQLAAQAGTTGDAMLAALRKASAGTISDTALQLAAMKASLLGVAQNADQLGPILAIARDRAQQMGISVEFAFDSLVTGLGRGSRLILDNVGVIVKADQANAAYAASVGKTVSQLTEAEQKQALINEVVRQGNETIAATGGAVESAATNQQRLAAAFENTKNKLGELVAGMSVGFVQGASDLLNVTNGTADGFASAAIAAANFSRSISGLPPLTQAQAQAVRDNTAAVSESVSAYGNAEAAHYGYAAAGQVVTGVAATEAAAHRDNSVAMQDAASVAAAAQTVQLGYANSMEMGTIQANAAAQAAQIKANADQVAAVDAETHRVAQEALAKQAMAAAQGLLAAGSAGASTAALLASSSSQVDVLTAAYYRLLAAQRAAGAGATQQQAADFRSMEVFGQTAAQRTAAIDKERQADAARSQQIIQTGSAAQKTAELQRIYNDAVRQSGPASAAAIQAQTALISAQEKGARAGGAGRARAAQAGADRLATIEQNTGNKIIDIDRSTQAKLVEIDQRAAEQRAAAFRKLQEEIATASADRRAQDEADDLDLIGVKDQKEAQRLNDRERAQAAAREREAAAAKEALAMAESGEAEAAEKVYGIRERQIGDQQALDEKYAERQRELSGNPEALAALQQQYDEGTRAIAAAADVRIAIAQAEAAQAKQAVEDEKAAVIAAAEDQKNQVVGRAQQSAEGVKKASGDARAKAVADLQAIGSAVSAIPTSKTITINVQQTGSTTTSGGGGGTRSAGGGTFLTHGPAHLTVGDNPGGAELVSVTPLSGKGRTAVGANMMRLGGGGTVVVDAGGGYTTPIAGTGGKSGKAATGGAGGAKAVDTKAATDALQKQIAFLKATAELAHLLKSPIPQIDPKALQNLAAESKRIGAVIGGQLVPISKENSKMLEDYNKAVGGSVNILKDVHDLRKELSDPQPPLDPAYIKALALDTRIIGGAVGGVLVPIAQTSLMELEEYVQAVSGSVSILNDVNDLRKELKEPHSPLDPDQLYHLAIDAQRISVVVKSLLVPYSEETADQVGRYADVVGSSVSALRDTTELTAKLFTDYQSPSDAQVNMIANDANRIARSVAAAAMTYDTKGLEAAKLFADAVGGTFTAFKDGLLFFDAIKSGDFELDTQALGRFETATAQTMDVARRLGAMASTIPTADIEALQATTAALSTQAEALIRLAAVPFGDLPAATAGFAQQAGVPTGGTTINNTFVLPQGTTQQVAYEVVKILNTQVGARR